MGTDGVQIIDEFRERIKSVTVSPTKKKKLSSVRIWREDKVLLDEIFAHLGLDESLNQSEKMGKLLKWVNELLEDEPTIPLPDQIDIQSSQAISETFPFQGELIKETITIEDEPDEATVAVSLPDDFNAVDATQTIQQSQDITTLIVKVEQLVDVMTQFISFSMQSATPLQSTAPPKNTRATTEAKPQTASDSAAPVLNSNDTTQQRSKRNSPEAETAIHKAIDAIIHHNNTIELHDLKWAISINAVKELVSDVTKSQRLVDKAITERKTEIDAHHAKYQIEPNHNHRHKRKRKINQVISVN